MKYIVSIVLIFFYHASFSQHPFGEQLKSARFQIVKSTVEFLATDTETFKNVKSTSCTGCKTYEDVEKFINDNQLTGAPGLVRDWKSAPIDSSFARGMIELEAFRSAVLGKIAGPSKQRRRELPKYNDYTKKLDIIVSGVVANKKTDSMATPAPSDKDQSDITILPDTAASDTTVMVGSAPATGKSSSGLQPYLSWGSAGLFALLAFYFYRRNMDLSQKNSQLESMMRENIEDRQFSEEKSRKFNEENLRLQDELWEERRQKDVLLEKYQLEKEKRKPLAAVPVETPAPEAPSIKPKPARPAPTPPPQKPVSVTRFARYADLGDGFSANDLLEEDDSETIFEIMISAPTLATFKVSDNEAAQRYALSNVSYFLGKTCKYDSFPTDNNTIRTDAPGELKLQGNKWLITNPAKISFT